MRVYSKRVGLLLVLLPLPLLAACSSEDPVSSGGAAGGGTGGASGGAGGNVSVAGGGAGGGAGSSSAGAAGSAMGGAGTGGGNAGGGSASGGSASGGSASGGSASGGSGGAAPDMKSQGCGKAAPAEFTPEMYIRKSLPDVAKTKKGAERVYELRLPKNYDMNRPYPVVFEDHGCDGSIPFHIEKATGTDSIVVALRAADNQDNNYMGGCFATGPNDAQLTEVPYFDAVVTTLELNLCVDKSKLYMEGYSSGSWLTNLLGCVRANVIRGQGNATGGLPKVPAECQGPIAAMLVHDDTDTMNTIQEGMKARDRIKAINGCSDETMPYQWDVNANTMSTCVAYQGCKAGYPLIWCPTHNKGHSDQVPITTVGLWKFWSSLPPRP
jgi:poly(3-hydroxybutyrate) depolymerase